MDKSSRRQILRDYKERKAPAGVYAVRCAGSGEVWVGATRNLDAQKNSVWFGLSTGGHVNRAMQAAWAAHGAAAFAYEPLERIEDEDLTPLGLADALKARERHWRDALGAGRAAG
ncbi:MAG: GIY-YIG nuclease family protein [Caulobacterales bacterium]|nr:GIY-YIG nuclease family protein [Caulobacterales bacterium]